MNESEIKKLISDAKNEDGSMDEGVIVSLIEFAYEKGWDEGGARMHECMTSGEEF